jgi:hypothetical protein
MKRISAACVAVAAIGLLASPAQAEISAEAARASVAPFYKALNSEFAKDSPELIRHRPRRNGCPVGAMTTASAAM